VLAVGVPRMQSLGAPSKFGCSAKVWVLRQSLGAPSNLGPYRTNFQLEAVVM
jgi:hypothetical protein